MNAAKKQGTGLAQFAATSKVAQGSMSTEALQPQTESLVHERTRGKSETVSITVRLSRGDWERVHQLAVSEGTSIQRLTVQGLSRLFIEKGLPQL